MEDQTELLRADETNKAQESKMAIPLDDNVGAKAPSVKRSTLLLVGLVCTIVSVAAGLAIGHAWGSSSSSSSSASTSSVPQCPKVYPNETTTPPALRMTKPRRETIVFLGDSITMAASDASKPGFALRLSGEYTRSGDVFNRGITVYNTKGFLSTAIPVLENEMATWLTPSVVVIWFGVNDATVVGGRYQPQHVPVKNYKKNLVEMIQRVQAAAPTVKVLLVTPMTVDNARAVDRTNEATAVYAEACREVMDSVKDVRLFDMFKYMMDTYPNATDRGNLQEDGLHLNSAGHGVAFELFKKEIQTLLPGFSSEKKQVPEWDTLRDFYPDNAKN